MAQEPGTQQPGPAHGLELHGLFACEACLSGLRGSWADRSHLTTVDTSLLPCTVHLSTPWGAGVFGGPGLAKGLLKFRIQGREPGSSLVKVPFLSWAFSRTWQMLNKHLLNDIQKTSYLFSLFFVCPQAFLLPFLPTSSCGTLGLVALPQTPPVCTCHQTMATFSKLDSEIQGLASEDLQTARIFSRAGEHSDLLLCTSNSLSHPVSNNFNETRDRALRPPLDVSVTLHLLSSHSSRCLIDTYSPRNTAWG